MNGLYSRHQKETQQNDLQLVLVLVDQVIMYFIQFEFHQVGAGIFVPALLQPYLCFNELLETRELDEFKHSNFKLDQTRA